QVGGRLNRRDRSHHVRHDLRVEDGASLAHRGGSRRIGRSGRQLIDVVRVGAHAITRGQPFTLDVFADLEFEFGHGDGGLYHWALTTQQQREDRKARKAKLGLAAFAFLGGVPLAIVAAYRLTPPLARLDDAYIA